jgi:hypothetical protein
MSHIPENRLMELGTDAGITPTEQESDHLAQCEQCSAVLEEERQLTDLLGQVAQAEVPAGFAHATRSRFVEAHGARRERRLGLGVAGIVAAMCAALGLVLVLGYVFPSIPIAIVVALARVLALVQVGLVVLARTPALALVVLAYGLVTLLFCTGVVGGLARWSARAKRVKVEAR